MAFWRQLVSPDEVAVDSIIVGGIAAMVSLIGMAVWQAWHDPMAFNCLSFGSGSATILGAIGAGKRLRDGVNNEPNSRV